MSDTALPLDAELYAPPAEDLAGLRRSAFLIGGIAAVLSVVGAFLDGSQFFRSYLIAVLFWVGIGVGTFAVGMLHHATGGGWGVVVRRVFDAAGRSLPWLFLLFVPIFFGIGKLYVWADAATVAADPILKHKEAYLNPTAFIVRAVIFFAIWIVWARWIDASSRRQDQTADPELPRRFQMMGSVGLVVYAVTMSFASIDWLMSLDPHWTSSIYGIYFLGSQGLSAFAFTIPVALWLSRRKPLADVLAPRHFHDYGKLLFAFVMLWAYFSYSQFLLIWAGNIPEEASWYVRRMHGGWKWVALGIVVFHFALPFLLLLSADLKKNARRLAVVAILLLVMRYVDLYWQAAPGFHGEGNGFSWLDPVTLVAVGGIWLGFFFRELGRRPMLPVGDPTVRKAIGHE